MLFVSVQECDVVHVCLLVVSVYAFPNAVVVSSEATWLKAFGCASNYSGASSAFRDGELRVIGLNFI